MIEFKNTVTFNAMRSCQSYELKQVGARECVLEKDGAFQEGIEEVMRRCNVLCTSKPLDFFQSSKEKVLEVRFISPIRLPPYAVLSGITGVLVYTSSRNPCLEEPPQITVELTA